MLLIFLFVNIFLFNIVANGKEKILADVKKSTGLNIGYSKLSLNFLGAVKLKQLSITDDEALDLKLNDVNVSFSLFSMLKNGFNPLAGVKKIRLKTLELNETHGALKEKIKTITEKFKGTTPTPKKEIDLPNITFEVDSIKIAITDFPIPYTLSLNKIKLNMASKTLKIDTIIDSNIKATNKINAAVNLRIKGTVDLEDEIATDFAIDFQKIDLNEFKLKKQKFAFNSKGSNFFLKRVEDLLPVDFLVTKNGNILKTNISLNNTLLEEFLEKKVDIAYLPSNIDLKANLAYDFSKKDLNGTLFSNLNLKKMSSIDEIVAKTNIYIRNNNININNSALSTNKGSVLLDGNISLDLNKIDIRAKVDNFEFANIKLTTELLFEKNRNVLILLTDNININDVDFGGFDCESVISDKRYTLKSRKDFNGYNVNGFIDTKNGLYVNMKHNLNNFKVSPVAKVFNKNVDANYFINTELETHFLKNNITIPKTAINIHDEKDKIANLNLSLKNKVVNYDSLNIDKFNIKSSGDINLFSKPFLFNAALNKDNFDFVINSSISNELISCSVNKNLKIVANLNQKYVSLKADKFELPLMGQIPSFSFNILYNMRNNSIRNGIFSVDNVELLKSGAGLLSSKIDYSNSKLSLNELSYKDTSNNIIGSLNSNLNIKSMLTKSDGELFLKDENKGESYSARYKIENGNIDGKVYLTQIDIKKFLKSPLSGFVNLRASLSGKVTNPAVELDGDISNGKLGNSKLEAYFFAKKNDNQYLLNRAQVTLGDNRISLKNSKIELNNGRIDLDVNGNIHAGVSILGKVLKLDFGLNGYHVLNEDKNREIMALNKDRATNMNLKIDQTTIGTFKSDQLIFVDKYPPLLVNIVRVKNKITARDIPEQFVYFTKDNEDMSLTVTDYYKNKILGANIKTKDKIITGKVNFNKFPVNAIQVVLKPNVWIDDGYLNGELVLNNNNGVPEYSGRVNLYSGVVNLPQYLQDKITNISGMIIGNKNRLIVSNVNGQLKKENVHGNGQIVFNGLAFESYAFHLNSDPVVSVINEGPVSAKGVAYLKDFLIEARGGSFNFIGDIVVDQAEVNLKTFMGVNEGSPKKSPPKTLPIYVALTLTMGDKVQVNYPIVNGVINKGDQFLLKYVGTEPNVYLGGKLGLKKGEISYLNKTFKVEKATFTFDENDPRIDPIVNIDSTYRGRDSRGSQVKITMTMTDRLLSFNTNFTAFPYKTQDEINSILGLGGGSSYASNSNTNVIDNVLEPNEIVDTKQNLDSIVNTSNYITNAFIFSPIESSIKNVTGLDTFSFSTNFLGNIIKSNTNFLDVLNDSTFSVGKYLSNELYFGSSMTFRKREDQTEQLFLPFDDKNYGLNLQFMLQLDLPYITFGYNFVPKSFTDFNIYNSIEHRFSIEANVKF